MTQRGTLTVLAPLLAVSALVFGKNLIRAMLSAQVEVPEPVWARLNWSWAAFFAFMGVANLFVAYSFPTDLWVSFKLFGATGLLLVFVVLQSFYLARHIPEDKPAQDGAAADKPRQGAP